MGKYRVYVVRTGYAHKCITVEADSQKQAEAKAVDAAGDYRFSEKYSDYEAEYVEEVSDE